MTVEVGYEASKLSCCKMERKHPFYLPGKVRKKKHFFLGSSKEVLLYSHPSLRNPINVGSAK